MEKLHGLFTNTCPTVHEVPRVLSRKSGTGAELVWLKNSAERHAASR